MKKRTRNILLGVVILSLLAIGGVFTSGLLKNKPQDKNNQNQTQSNVLGEETNALLTGVPDKLGGVNQILQNTLQNTKEIVTEKMAETEKNIISIINKEVSNLTKSQVENLKWQVCRDLGVVQNSPTPSQ